MLTNFKGSIRGTASKAYVAVAYVLLGDYIIIIFNIYVSGGADA